MDSRRTCLGLPFPARLAAGVVTGLALASCVAVVSGPASIESTDDNPGTCGCVDSNGVCEAGTSAQACGANGSSCFACAANESCTAGACINTSPTQPGNCAPSLSCSGDDWCTNAKVPSGACTCVWNDCQATKLSCSCPSKCYATPTPSDCQIGIDPASGKGTIGGSWGGSCGGVSCTPVSDLNQSPACDGANCKPPVNVLNIQPVNVSPPTCPANPSFETAIFLAYSPGPGSTVMAGGQIKAWVYDENPPCIGWNLKVDPATGVTTGFSDNVPSSGCSSQVTCDGQPYVALYLDDVGGTSTAYSPNRVLGDFTNNNNTGAVFPHLSSGDWQGNVGGCKCDSTGKGPAVSYFLPVEPVVPPAVFVAGTGVASIPARDVVYDNSGAFVSEYAWDVDKLDFGSCGVHLAFFHFYDGDYNRGSGCAAIDVTQGCSGQSPYGTTACLNPPVSPAPATSTITVKCNGKAVLEDPTNGWTFDSTSECFTFHGTSSGVGGQSCSISYL